MVAKPSAASVLTFIFLADHLCLDTWGRLFLIALCALLRESDGERSGFGMVGG